MVKDIAHTYSKVNCKIFNGFPWHSQRDIADFLGKSVKTISEHLEFIKDDSRILTSTNTEGSRTVTRQIQYYPYTTVVSLLGQLQNPTEIRIYRKFLQELGIVWSDEIPVPCSEKNVKKYLHHIFDGLLKIEFEKPVGNYRLDGFIPELKIIFEIDGRYHRNAQVKLNDQKRQEYIQSVYPDFEILRFTESEFTQLANILISRMIK